MKPPMETQCDLPDVTETEKLIWRRRSVRAYRKKPVPADLVLRMLEAARFAPSAGNYQPWKFIVVRDPAIISDMTHDVVENAKRLSTFLDYRKPGASWRRPLANLMIRWKRNELHPTPFGAISLIANGRLRLFHGASTVIFIFKDVRGVSNPDLDCGIAGQNMVLAAHSMGLGTCWVGFAKLAFESGKKWNNFFGIRFPYKFASSLAVGWPKGEPDGFIERPVPVVDWYENGEKKHICGFKPVNRREEDELTPKERRHLPRLNDPKEITSGSIAVDAEKCIGCGQCVTACPANALRLENKKAGMLENNECVCCGDCLAICPEQAIRLASLNRFAGYYRIINKGDPERPVFEKFIGCSDKGEN
jgi:nitroreductase/ferredoxin